LLLSLLTPFWLALLGGTQRRAPFQVQFNDDKSARKPAVVRLCC